MNEKNAFMDVLTGKKCRKLHHAQKTEKTCSHQPQYPTHPSTSLLLSIHIPLCPLPQHILLNLPRTRLRQLAYNHHLPRHHEPTNAAILLGPLNHLLPQRLAIRPVLGRHKRLGPLAPVRIRDGADADFEDGGVRREHGFEGDRGNVFAAWEH
jgi:hypothetical protein